MLLGVISDIHEDFINLEKAISYLKKISCDEIICLGDIIGYNPVYFNHAGKLKPSQSLKLVRDNCTVVVAGNHDLFAINKLPQYDAGFKYPANWYEFSRKAQERISRDKVWIYEEEHPAIDNKDYNYINSLPEYFVKRSNVIDVFLSHYPYPDLTGSTTTFIENHEQLLSHFNFIKEKKCDLSISGHRHVEGCLLANEKEIKVRSFGKYNLSDNILWIDGPCITKGHKENGFMVLDTEEMIIEIIPLESL